MALLESQEHVESKLHAVINAAENNAILKCIEGPCSGPYPIERPLIGQ